MLFHVTHRWHHALTARQQYRVLKPLTTANGPVVQHRIALQRINIHQSAFELQTYAARFNAKKVWRLDDDGALAGRLQDLRVSELHKMAQRVGRA